MFDSERGAKVRPDTGACRGKSRIVHFRPLLQGDAVKAPVLDAVGKSPDRAWIWGGTGPERPVLSFSWIYATIGGIEMISENHKASTFVTLSRGQARALPFMLSARTVEEGCRAAGISKQCFYNWMKQEAFREEYRARQSGFVSLAMETLKGNAVEAAEKLSAMMSEAEGPLLRRVCKDVIDLSFKIREIEEIEARLERLEKLVMKESDL
jgi:hypothetical protein